MIKNPEIKEILRISEKLIGFLDQETKYLREMRVADFSKMQDEKFSLINAYEKSSDRLKKYLANDTNISAPDLQILRRRMKEVNEVVTANKRALHVMNDMNNRLIKTIIDSLNSDKDSVRGYERNGRKSKNHSPSIVSMSRLNKDL